MRDYEAMLILPPEADEATVNGAIDRIGKVVSGAGGAVGDIQRWGRRRLAYELNRQHEGYYVVVRFTAEPGAQNELDRTLKIADEVIRAKIMLLPEKKNEKTASPASA